MFNTTGRLTALDVPKIFNIGNKDGEFFLEPVLTRYNVPTKIYGSFTTVRNRFWNSFRRARSSVGILLTGDAGSGKTMLSNLISNIGIDNGYMVVNVGEVTANIKLVRFLSELPNAIIIFDEFGKNFGIKLQEKMLTMFSSTENGKKLYIITENNKNMVSQYIRNRPGRVRFHLDFGKLSEDVFDEVCNFAAIDKDFQFELRERFISAGTFSFDHLQAIINEHKEHPNDGLDLLLEYLNLELLECKKIMTPRNITGDDGAEYTVIVGDTTSGMAYEMYKRGIYVTVQYERKAPDNKETGKEANNNNMPYASYPLSVMFSNKDLISRVGDTFKFKKGKLTIDCDLGDEHNAMLERKNAPKRILNF